jgi:hypothetical protein
VVEIATADGIAEEELLRLVAAVETADVVLMHSDPLDVATAAARDRHCARSVTGNQYGCPAFGRLAGRAGRVSYMRTATTIPDAAARAAAVQAYLDALAGDRPGIRQASRGAGTAAPTDGFTGLTTIAGLAHARG